MKLLSDRTATKDALLFGGQKQSVLVQCVNRPLGPHIQIVDHADKRKITGISTYLSSGRSGSGASRATSDPRVPAGTSPENSASELGRA